MGKNYKQIFILIVSQCLISGLCDSGFQNFVSQHSGISSQDYVSFSRKYAKAWLDGVIPTATGNVSAQCKIDSVLYRDELKAFNPWALQMFDATGKLPDGILNGNWHALGDYEECLRIKPVNVTFRGKYCQVFLSAVQSVPEEKMFPMWLFKLLASNGPELQPGPQVISSANQLSFGICLPSSCTPQDVSRAISDMSTGSSSIGGFGFAATTEEGFCSVDTEEPVELDDAAIAMLVILSILGFFHLTGTLLDIAQRYALLKRSEGTIFNIFGCFSLLANGSKLLSSGSGGDSLSCIHGMRFISFTWVLLGHSYVFLLSYPTANFGLLYDQAKNSIAFQAISSAALSVDSFFFMTGLLLGFLFLKAMKSTGKKWGVTAQVNPGMLIVHRYLRLTPVYALILGFYTTLWPKLSDGPAWGMVELYSGMCRKEWWTNLLYIQTLVFDTQGCMPVTWYLATEFQIFIVATLFVWLIHRFELIGVITTAVATLVGAIIGAVFMAEWDMPPTGLLFGTSQFEGFIEYTITYYRMPWFRYPPFFVGVLVGWILFKVTQETYMRPSWLKPNLARLLAVIGWAVAAITASAILYGLFEYNDARLMPKEVQIIYGGFHRVIWSVCLGWVVFACVTGYGGPINAFLSWSPFAVLGRLTFCAYLIHLDWINFFFAHSRAPLYYTNLTMTYSLLGHTTVTLLLATIATLAFESPFLNLEKLLFKSSKTSKAVLEQKDEIGEEKISNTSEGTSNKSFSHDHEKES